MKAKNFFRYEMFIVVGIVMATLSFLKVKGLTNFSSDWFWFIAGIGLIVEGTISLIKQKRFDQKYKVVLRKGAK